MIPGPTIIRRCSKCGRLIQQATVGTWNTFGARFWTDGKMEAPMRPDSPRLVVCPHCGTLDWIEELEEVGEVLMYPRPQRVPPGLKKARPYRHPLAPHYFKFLSGGPFDREKERHLRLRAWWAGNDLRRGFESDLPMSSDETANLQAFAGLLDEADDGDRLMKAEVLRELGRFAEARALLEPTFDEEQVDGRAVDFITNLVGREDPLVREVKLADQRTV